MAAFSSRPGGYKGGVILLFFATAVFLVGFGAPYWASAEILQAAFLGHSVTVTYHEGIWTVCISTEVAVSTTVGCSSYGIYGFPGWFHTVRVLTSVCNTGLVIACVYALFTNFCRSVPGPRVRLLEILAAAAGLLGFIGCMIYVGKRNDVDFSDKTGKYVAFFYASNDWTISWAFYMAAIGSVLSVIAAIIIAITNKPVEVETNSGGMVMTTVTTNVQPGYAPQAYVAQPGYAPQPYVAQPGYAPQPYVAQADPVKAGYPATN